MSVRNKSLLSGAFLIVAVLIGIFVYNRISKIPQFEDRIEVKPDGLYYSKHFRYPYALDYPVTIQRVMLSSSYDTNTIGVHLDNGNALKYTLNKQELIVFFDKPIRKNQMVDFWIESKVKDNLPFLNLVYHSNNRYTLHYVSYENDPANKRKRFVLPDGAHITEIYSTVKDSETTSRSLLFKGAFNALKKFDISVAFEYSNRISNSIAALPPILTGDYVMFRVPKAMTPVTPRIAATFTGGRPLQFLETNDYYFIRMKLPKGSYRYQLTYNMVPVCDDSVMERAINVADESESQIDIDGLQTNG